MGDLVTFDPNPTVTAQPLEEVSPLYPPHGLRTGPDQPEASSGFMIPQAPIVRSFESLEAAAPRATMAPQTVPSVYDVTHELYLKVRNHFPQTNDPVGDHNKTIRGVVHLLATKGTSIHPNVPPADERLIRRMAADLDWGYHYDVEHRKKRMDRPEEVVRSEVESLRLIRDAAKKILTEAQTDLLPFSITGNNGEMVKTPISTAAFSKYSTAWAVYNSTETAYQEALTNEKQTSLERTDTKAFKNRVTQKYTAIYRDYDGMGAVYEVLCQQLAECLVRLEMLSESGRQSEDTFKSLIDQQTKIIAQIQKHTESTKSESVSTEAKEMVKNLFKAIEPVIANENPTLWKKVVNVLATSWPKTPTAIRRGDGIAS